MASARHVLEKLRSSDGHIRIKTLSGVSVVVAAIALLVGVLPAIADHATSAVTPQVINLGGGSGACSVTIDGRLPSAARNEIHINNPTPGTHQLVGSDGTQITLVVDGPTTNRVFDFDVVTPGFVVYDVIVNGGPKSNHYDYDRGPGPVTADEDLHAPRKNVNSLHNLSHINICYDVPGVVLFACDTPLPLTEEEGLFRVAEATIFGNSVVEECNNKRAEFFIDNDGDPPSVTLAFEGDGSEIIAGRLDITKDFGDPGLFVDLEYDGPGTFVPVQWCNIRDKADGDGNEFDDVLGTVLYPTLDGVVDGADPAISCKVYEEEDATGIQYTVVYFELEDPQWR